MILDSANTSLTRFQKTPSAACAKKSGAVNTLRLGDALTITVSALLICTLGGLIPALWAAKLEPVEALRHD